MNCRDYEALLVESARQSPDAKGATEPRWELKAALEHAAQCASCAERLADERVLQTDLRALAGVEARREPSPGCEATLMAAYRTERGREVHTRRWIFALSGAMAASFVILLGSALMLSSESSKLVRSMSARFGSLAAHRSATAAGAGARAGSVASDETAGESDLYADAATGQQEEVTDFMAFYPGADVGSLDSGALVRVRIPSSALGSFGLPVAQGSEEQWVSADLLVGEDGSPQAIRFVRPAGQASRN